MFTNFKIKYSTVSPSYSKIKSFPILFLLYSYLLYSTRGFRSFQNRSLFRRRLLYLWYHNMKPPAIITEPSNLCSGLFVKWIYTSISIFEFFLRSGDKRIKSWGYEPILILLSSVYNISSKLIFFQKSSNKIHIFFPYL